MKYRNFAILATSLLLSCNVSDTPTTTTENGVSIAPRLMLTQGTSLPVTDSVRIKVWSSSPVNVWYEKTLPWSAKFVVISGIPQGTNFLFAIEGRKLQSDSTSAIWWSGNQSGTTNSSQSLDPVDVPVWVSIGDTLAPTISGLKDTILDSAASGVRLRWTVADNSLASAWFGTNQLTPTGNIVSDTVSVAIGSSITLKAKATDNAGNLSIRIVKISRKSRGNGLPASYGIPWNSAINYDSIQDSRDGQIYRTVDIGSQKWMAQNLNYDTLDGSGSWNYKNAIDSGKKYGRLYNWNTATQGVSSGRTPSGVKGICPTGWHIPSNAEWDTLELWVSRQHGWIQETSGKALKSLSGWSSGNGLDAFGFRAIPSGYRHDGHQDYFSSGDFGKFWSSTEKSPSDAWSRNIYNAYDSIPNGPDPKGYAFSIRCISD